MNKYEFTVVIPTHERKALLVEMLESLGAQNYPMDKFEVVVVVDGSKDGTWEALQNVNVPFQLHRIYQKQSGAAAARNRGASAAQGKILLFLDDDLLPQPRLLREHARVHAQDENAVVLGRFLPSKVSRRRGWDIWEEQIFEKHFRHMSDGRRPPAGRRLYSGNFSIRNSHFQRLGGFNERFNRNEDVELGVRLEASGMHFHHSQKAAAVHRGYRSFRSWYRSAYLYGRSDIILAMAKKEQPHLLADVFRWYVKGPLLGRIMVRVGLVQPGARQVFSLLALLLAETCTWLRFHSVAHWFYSTIYKLQYWQGVADELGGRSVLFDYASRFPRPSYYEKSRDAVKIG